MRNNQVLNNIENLNSHSFTNNNSINENYLNLSIDNNTYDNNILGIIGGNDNNYNRQLNSINNINALNESIDYDISEFNQIISPIFRKNFYKKIYGDINICNSILIMLNNNQEIKEYLDKNKRKNQVNILKMSFGCSLANILYQSHQFLWNNEKINSKEIFCKYTDYTRFKYGQNEKNLSDINNTEKILESIYTQINLEFTFAKNMIKTDNNNNVNNDYNTNSNNFLDEFKRCNKSIISAAFTGFYQYNINRPNKSFQCFSFVKFNLNEIEQFYDSINANEINLNHFYSSINLYNCFDYTFKDKTHSIYSFPKILTIVLSATEECNFILHPELNLVSYTNKFSNNNNGSYFLTSILCQMSYNKKFIIYIFDTKEGFWFSLTDEEIRKVDSIDINAMPLILFYQLKSTFQQEYNEIKIKNKLRTIINFNLQGGLLQKTQLFFDEKDTIIDVRKKIKTWFDIKQSFILLINGSLAKKDESLSKVLGIGHNILVMLKNN